MPIHKYDCQKKFGIDEANSMVSYFPSGGEHKEIQGRYKEGAACVCVLRNTESASVMNRELFSTLLRES